MLAFYSSYFVCFGSLADIAGTCRNVRSDDASKGRRPLFLKPTVIGGDKLQDDYEVLDENRKPIGRIMLHPQGPQGRWVVLALCFAT